MKTIITPDRTTLAEAAADFFVSQAQAALEERGRFTVALAGGSTPRALYTLLAQPPFVAQVNWEATHLFFGDERCVPPDHPDSNYRMVIETLQVPLPAGNLHRIRGELPPTEAAARYERELGAWFEETPRFDLLLLGLGEDGHIASLFPHSAALGEQRRWVVAVPHDTPPPPPVTRVTLTLPVLNAARHILFLVSGAAKAHRVAEVLQAPTASAALPASLIRPAAGEVSWLIDRAAAARL